MPFHARSIGQKGQAFDVFKLLIAAVVAGAILLILLNILQVIPGIGSQEPGKVAAEHVKSKSNDIGNPELVPNVTFKQGDSLNTKTIASKSEGLSEDQICVTVSESAPNKDQFEDLVGAGKIVKYNGTTTQKTRLFVLCDRENEIDVTLTTYGYDKLSSLGINLGHCAKDPQKTQKFCVVSVVSES